MQGGLAHRCSRRWARQWLLQKHEFLDDLTANKVFLDDSLDDIGTAGVVPYAIWIHQHDGPVLADAQAVCFAAVNPAVTRQFQFIEPLLQVAPRF